MNGLAVILELAIDVLTIIRDGVTESGATSHADILKALNDSIAKAQQAVSSLSKAFADHDAEADALLAASAEPAPPDLGPAHPDTAAGAEDATVKLPTTTGEEPTKS